MSFFDDASLVMIPSGYKTSKVYSVKPTDGSGDLTFSRASTATRVNASGLVASVASNVPRLDYTNSTCPKLLLEPQRTNLVLYSEALNAVWTLNAITVTPDAATSPSGVVNADKLIATAVAGAKYAFQLLTVTNAVAYTSSAYFKAAEYNYAFMRLGGITGNPYVIYNLATQAVVATSGLTSSTISSVGNGWYRVTVTATQTSVVLAPVVMVIPSTGYTLSSDNLPQFTGNGTSGGFVWGVQSEEGAYATSYIPTEGTAVTRIADAASKTGISSLIGQTQGTIFVEEVYDASVANNNGLDDILVALTDGTTNNLFLILHYGSSASSYGNKVRFFIRNSNTTQVQFDSAALASGTYKIALAYNSNDVVAYINGVQIGTDTSATIPATSVVTLVDPITTNAATKTVRESQVLLFKTRLSNSDLAALTA